jgi:hypothetical protein
MTFFERLWVKRVSRDGSTTNEVRSSSESTEADASEQEDANERLMKASYPSIGYPRSITYFCNMKHSQTIGILLCLALFYCTTQALVIIESHHLVITGWKAEGTNFGQPGKLFVYLGGLSILFFALPFIWAKRINVAIGAIIIAWSFRNFMVLSACQMGDCPQKQWPLYACVVLSIGILIMSFLPKIKIPKS